MSSYLTSATAGTTYLPLTGGTLTGPLSVNGNRINLKASQYINSGKAGVNIHSNAGLYLLNIDASHNYCRINPSGIQLYNDLGEIYCHINKENFIYNSTATVSTLKVQNNIDMSAIVQIQEFA